MTENQTIFLSSNQKVWISYQKKNPTLPSKAFWCEFAQHNLIFSCALYALFNQFQLGLSLAQLSPSLSLYLFQLDWNWN